MVEGVRFDEEEEEADADDDADDEDKDKDDDAARGAEFSVHCCNKNVDTCVSHALFGVSNKINTKSNRERRGVAMAVLVERSAERS